MFMRVSWLTKWGTTKPFTYQMLSLRPKSWERCSVWWCLSSRVAPDEYKYLVLFLTIIHSWGININRRENAFIQPNQQNIGLLTPWPLFRVWRMENTFARLWRVEGTSVIFAKYATLAASCAGEYDGEVEVVVWPQPSPWRHPPPSTHPPVNLQSTSGPPLSLSTSPIHWYPRHHGTIPPRKHSPSQHHRPQ